MGGDADFNIQIACLRGSNLTALAFQTDSLFIDNALGNFHLYHFVLIMDLPLFIHDWTLQLQYFFSPLVTVFQINGQARMNILPLGIISFLLLTLSLLKN